jgi:hypothetical protein
MKRLQSVPHDAGDSKSPAFTGVRVRISPWAPITAYNYL